MARPKKLSSDVMLQILESYYAECAVGNPELLKYSLLEKYANGHGYVDVKAYDFKRDKSVHSRLEELKKLCREADGHRVILGTAYKSLDVMGLISQCHSKTELVEALTEMDRNWRITHDTASDLQRKWQQTNALYHEMEIKASELEQMNQGLETDLKNEKHKNRTLIEENRYLRKMLKTYLYPAIANQILLDEQVISATGTSVTQVVMDELADPPAFKSPGNITQSISNDRKNKSEIRSILDAMWEDSE